MTEPKKKKPAQPTKFAPSHERRRREHQVIRGRRDRGLTTYHRIKGEINRTNSMIQQIINMGSTTMSQRQQATLSKLQSRLKSLEELKARAADAALMWNDAYEAAGGDFLFPPPPPPPPPGAGGGIAV